MAQSIASRSRRQQHTEPDDVVLARVLQFTEWARRNVVVVGVGLLVVVALIGGFLWQRSNQARETENAAIAFLQVEQSVSSGDAGLAVSSLQDFIQDYADTSYGDEARVMLGELHLRAERPADAIDVLEPLADRIASSVVGPQAGLLLATAYQAADRTDDAIATYLRVGEEAPLQFRREQGLMGAALLREDSGDYAGAAEIYGRLVDMAEEGSMEKSMYEMRLQEAEAQLSAE